MQRLAHGYGLVEGPVWMGGRGLAFSDVHGGGAYRLHADGQFRRCFRTVAASAAWPCMRATAW